MVAIVVTGSLYRLVHEPPPDGLGSDYATIGRLIAHDAEVLEAWTLTTNQGHGGDRKSETIKENIVNLDWPEKPQGNSREAALRRQRGRRPDAPICLCDRKATALSC